MKKKIRIAIVLSICLCSLFGMVSYATTYTIKSNGIIQNDEISPVIKFDSRDFTDIQKEIDELGRLGVTDTGDMKVVNDKVKEYEEHCK